MTTYTFTPVTIRATKSGKCPKCGKTYYRTVSFCGTVNPWNRNPDGSICTEDDIYEKLCVQRDEWLKGPIEPHNCKEKLEPEPSNPITINDLECMVDTFNKKFKEINKLKSQIQTLKNELKEEAKFLIDKTFDNIEYDRKSQSYKARESKITDVYLPDADCMDIYFTNYGRDKISKQFTYDYEFNTTKHKSLYNLLYYQISMYIQNNDSLKNDGDFTKSFNILFEKEEKTDEDIQCLKYLELYFKLDKIIYNEDYYQREQECLKKLNDIIEKNND